MRGRIDTFSDRFDTHEETHEKLKKDIDELKGQSRFVRGVAWAASFVLGIFGIVWSLGGNGHAASAASQAAKSISQLTGN